MSVIVDNLKVIRDFFRKPSNQESPERLERYYSTLNSVVEYLNSIDGLEEKYAKSVAESLEKDYGMGTGSVFNSWESLEDDPMLDALTDIVRKSHLASDETLLKECISNYKNCIARFKKIEAQEYITWLTCICKENLKELSKNQENGLASYYDLAIIALNSHS